MESKTVNQSFDHYLLTLINKSNDLLSVAMQRDLLNNCYDSVKKEILQNLITLSNLDKKFYLENLLSKIHEADNLYLNDSTADVNSYLKQYNANFNFEALFIRENRGINVLHDIINAHPEKLHEIATDELPYHHIQDIAESFFHYVSSLSVTKVESMINVKLKEIEEATVSQNTTPLPMTLEKIKYDSFNEFLSRFKYNYPYEMCALSFIHQIKEDSDYLKKEILANFINLTLDEKLAYLESIKFDIEKLKPHVWSTKDRLKKWYEKYKVPEDFIYHGNYISNPLYQFLQSDRPSFKECNEPDYNPDKEASMDDFYNYYYGQALDEMLTFIFEQQNKLQPMTTPEQAPSYKIKSSLSVTQLAFLFRALKDEKLISIPDGEAESFYKFIADTFSSKRKDTVSPDSFKNNFLTLDPKAAEFWDEKFLHLRQFAQKKQEIL